MAQYSFRTEIIKSPDPLVPDTINLLLVDAEGNVLKRGDMRADEAVTPEKIQEKCENIALLYQEEQSAEYQAKMQAIQDANTNAESVRNSLGETFQVSV